MKEKLKRFFRIDMKKNFNKYKIGYGVAIGIVIACIWCTIGIYAAPYIVHARKQTKSSDIAHADTTTISLNTYYSFDIRDTWTSSSIPQVNSNTNGDVTASFTVSCNETTYSGNTIQIHRQKSNVVNSMSIMFRNSAATYPYLNINANNNGKILNCNLNTDSGTIALTTSDTSIIKFTSGISSFPSDLTYNLKLWLTPAIMSYNITSNITNGTLSQSTIQANTTNTLQITPDTGYIYPATISYTGTASAIDYYDDTGEIVITNPTSDFTISATCREYTHTILSGYYLIYPPNLPYEDEVLEIEFKIIDLLYGEMPTTEPLNVAISTNTYHILYRTQRQLNNGLLALRSLNDQNPRELWGDYQQDYLRGAIVINVTSDCEYTGTNNIAKSLYSITADDLEELRYWGYGVARSHATIGYDDGFNNGYTDGVNDQILGQTASGIISQIFSGLFGNVLAVEIFPGFPIYIFILVPIVFALIGLLLWLIRGK